MNPEIKIFFDAFFNKLLQIKLLILWYFILLVVQINYNCLIAFCQEQYDGDSSFGYIDALMYFFKYGRRDVDWYFQIAKQNRSIT